MEIIYNTTQIVDCAVRLLAGSNGKKVWAFHAPMGAGKTTLIHALCKEVLAVAETVSSPTFAIINEYSGKAYPVIYHMDWYRLKDENEAINTGVEDALENADLCLVEWPEKAAPLLPDDTYHIYIAVIDAATRKISTR